MASLSNQQVLDQLYIIRDTWLTSGKTMQKNIETKDGGTIFYRTLEDVEAWIDLYETKVSQEQGNGGRISIIYMGG